MAPHGIRFHAKRICPVLRERASRTSRQASMTSMPMPSPGNTAIRSSETGGTFSPGIFGYVRCGAGFARLRHDGLAATAGSGEPRPARFVAIQQSFQRLEVKNGLLALALDLLGNLGNH